MRCEKGEEMKRIFLTALLLCSTVCLLLACGVKDACADGHSFTSYVSNGDATCTEDGTKTAKCERCGTSETVTDEGSAGHLFGEWVLSASGGAGCMEDFTELFKTLPRVDAGLAASIFHFGEVKICDLKEKLLRDGINVRTASCI